MDKFPQKISDSVGAQLHGMNSSFVKMKKVMTDTSKSVMIHEYRKILDMDEELKGAHVDWNQGKAVITGFHSETSEPEVIQLLKESITEMGMAIENARIECTAKPITHAFIHFKNDEERNKFVRSAKMLKKKLRGRKLKITRSMDAEERFHQKRMAYVKYYIHEKHNRLW